MPPAPLDLRTLWRYTNAVIIIISVTLLHVTKLYLPTGLMA